MPDRRRPDEGAYTYRKDGAARKGRLSAATCAKAALAPAAQSATLRPLFRQHSYRIRNTGPARNTQIKRRQQMSEITQSQGGAIDAADVARFSALAAEWWDPDGPFRPLHRINPCRLQFIRARAEEHFGLDAKSLHPLAGLRVADIGCGGGLLSEPLARLGARVTGVDASAEGIAAARLHAREVGLEIDYRHGTAEDLAAGGERFDMVVAMEIIEHVPDPQGFVTAAAAPIAPGGLFLGATLNRTMKSLALAKIAAEYILRWVPAGTHDWRHFLKPSEFARLLRHAGLSVTCLQGMSYDIIHDRWTLGEDLDINYMIAAVKPSS